MIHIQVKLFAIARDIVGADSVTLTLPENSLAEDALNSLFQHHPTLRQWREHLRVAVNREYSPTSTPLHDGDELAIIPPVSGG
jgi:molybdopterin converting factor subunit 1